MCSMGPCRICYDVSSCFSSPNIRDPLRPKSPPKVNKMRKKTVKPKPSTSRQGFMEHVYQISGKISETRRGRWLLNIFGVIRLNQPAHKNIYLGGSGVYAFAWSAHTFYITLCVSIPFTVFAFRFSNHHCYCTLLDCVTRILG